LRLVQIWWPPRQVADFRQKAFGGRLLMQRERARRKNEREMRKRGGEIDP
jgi:hypothetical protein